MRIIYKENCTKVINSYQVQKEKDIKYYVKCIIANRKMNNLPVTRDFNSYVGEWKAHNRLYNLGIKKDHTKDVDMEENISRKNEIFWRILGL